MREDVNLKSQNLYFPGSPWLDFLLRIHAKQLYAEYSGLAKVEKDILSRKADIVEAKNYRDAHVSLFWKALLL